MLKFSLLQKKNIPDALDFFELSFNSLEELVWLKDPDGLYIFINTKFQHFFSLSPQQVCNKNDAEIFDGKEFIGSIIENTEKCIEAEHNVAHELRLYAINAVESSWFEVTHTPVFDSDGDLLFTLSIAKDITQQKQREEKLINDVIKSDQRLHNALKATQVGIWEWDLEHGEWYATPSYYSMLGYTPPPDGKADLDVELEKIHPSDRDVALRNINAVLTGEKKDYEYFSRVRHANGNYIWITVRCMVIETDSQGKPLRILGVKFSIDELKKAQEKAEWLLSHDNLTELPNRTEMTIVFQKMLETALIDGTTLALLYIDLDRFKSINDTLGYRTGDMLLIEVSKRLKTLVSETFNVAKQGADEFIAIMVQTNKASIEDKAIEIKSLLSKEFNIGIQKLLTSVSIGIAIATPKKQNLDELSKCADIALSNAKQSGSNQHIFFDETMRQNYLVNAQIEQALHTAIRNNEFSIHYQPQISLKNGSIVGAEALLRWDNAKLGKISPNNFIPVAEANGYIRVIGEWVIKEAVTQMQQWEQSGTVLNKLAINLSSIQFHQSDLPEYIESVIRTLDVAPSKLEVELTERVAMNDSDSAIIILNKLHDMGLTTSIDDFGTGYSSLSYLQRLPLDKLKIDMSFVKNMLTNEGDLAIVTAIISLAKNLGLKTIAEGVETPQEIFVLKELGCDQVQGYYFSKPLPAKLFEQFCSEYNYDDF